MVFQLAYLALAFLAGVLAYQLAVQKGRNRRGWTIASVLFVFPAFVLALLPRKVSAV